MFFLFFCVVATLLFGVLIATAYITYLVRHANHGKKYRDSKEKISVCTVLGSGGHTTEMLALMQELSKQYTPRTYFIADTDEMSEAKVLEFEASREGTYSIERIPRSREVGQSYASSIGTTLRAFWFSLARVWKCNPDLVLLNGPGTCIPVAFAAALFDLMRLRDTVLIYEESICRVHSLSLSGAILYYSGLADEVIVQWLGLKSKYPRTKFVGELDRSPPELNAQEVIEEALDVEESKKDI